MHYAGLRICVPFSNLSSTCTLHLLLVISCHPPAHCLNFSKSSNIKSNSVLFMPNVAGLQRGPLGVMPKATRAARALTGRYIHV